MIGNAIKHSNGPLDVYVSIDEVKSDGIMYYSVIVEDNGPGIPDTQKSKLLIPFEDTKTQTKGLGLRLVEALVTRFGGKVRVEDRVPGDYTKGAKFVVMLPAAAQ